MQFSRTVPSSRDSVRSSVKANTCTPQLCSDMSRVSHIFTTCFFHLTCAMDRFFYSMTRILLEELKYTARRYHTSRTEPSVLSLRATSQRREQLKCDEMRQSKKDFVGFFNSQRGENIVDCSFHTIIHCFIRFRRAHQPSPNMACDFRYGLQ